MVVPVAFALGRLVGEQTAVFALFGSFALTLLVDFVAPVRRRLRAYLVLVAAAAVLVTVGSLCSKEPALGVAVMGVIAFTVLLVSIASPLLVQATPATLLMFVLPVCVPAGTAEIPARLAGLGLAAALCIPAVMTVWPTPYRARLHAAVAEVADVLAEVADALAQDLAPRCPKELEERWAQLLDVFEATAYPPEGAAPGDDALLELVSRLGRVKAELEASARARGQPGAGRLFKLAGEVLALIASMLRGQPSATPERLEQAVAALSLEHEHALAVSVEELVGSASAGAGRDGGPWVAPKELSKDPVFRGRVLASAVELAGRAWLAAAAEARGSGRGQRLRAVVRQGAYRMRAHASWRSVWLHNSLRGAFGLTVAVLVVQLVELHHGFWVVLGTLSVLRSNAAGTGSTALRALGGTIVGLVVGTLVLLAARHSTGALWAILALAVLMAGFAGPAISFAAGQAAFSVVVLVAFTLLSNDPGHLVFIRAEDVAIGCGVALVVGLLFWPRGASRALGQALDGSLVAGTDYVGAALGRLVATKGAREVAGAARVSWEAGRRLDDAFRQYLLERGAKTVSATELTTLVVGTNQLAVFADMLAAMPSPPRPGHEPPPALARAGTSLVEGYGALRRWYEGVGAVLSDRRGARIPTLEPASESSWRVALARGLDAAARSGHPDDVRLGLRLLWAGQGLEEDDLLRRELAVAATAFGVRRTWLGRSRRQSV